MHEKLFKKYQTPSDLNLKFFIHKLVHIEMRKLMCFCYEKRTYETLNKQLIW